MSEDSTLGLLGNEELRAALRLGNKTCNASAFLHWPVTGGAVGLGAASASFDPVYPVDVALLTARYIAAFERYHAQAARLAEQSERSRARLVQQLEDEQKALEDFAAMRTALLVSLAMSVLQIAPPLAAETRDDVIRRSIAKRDRASLDSARKRRLNRRRRIA